MTLSRFLTLYFSELVCLFVCFFWNYGSVSESTTWISQAIFIIHLAGLMGFKLFKKTDSKSETRRRSFSFLRRRSCSREERRSENFLRPRRTGEGQSPEVRTSQEVASALRKIGVSLYFSRLPPPRATCIISDVRPPRSFENQDGRH